MHACVCVVVSVCVHKIQELRCCSCKARLGLQASSELHIEVKKLTGERQRLATEVQMKREMEQQYAKRCTLQVPPCLTFNLHPFRRCTSQGHMPQVLQVQSGS